MTYAKAMLSILAADLAAFVFVTLVCFAASARAGEMVASNTSGDEIHLADKPCEHTGTLALLKEEYRSIFRSAWAMVHGKYFAACWAVEPEKREVVIVYEDGDRSRISTGVFRYRPGT